jgi:copper chaperone CopZ
MTCDHCVRAVSGEVGKIAGVESVEVDLASGRVTVTGEGFTDEQIPEAVDEARLRARRRRLARKAPSRPARAGKRT